MRNFLKIFLLLVLFSCGNHEESDPMPINNTNFEHRVKIDPAQIGLTFINS